MRPGQRAIKRYFVEVISRQRGFFRFESFTGEQSAIKPRDKCFVEAISRQRGFLLDLGLLHVNREPKTPCYVFCWSYLAAARIFF